MVFQPVIGLGGYPGWLTLQRTETRQREVFEASPSLQRNINYFRENIANATTAEALVSDRRLLTVALGAFGLDEEIGKRAFVQKVLEGGTQQSSAFANRLGEPRYRAFAEAFGYGNVDAGSNVLLDSFREDIIARYKVRAFDRAVGEVDSDARLALNFRREAAALVADNATAETKWFRILGQRPLREVISTALNIPSEAAQLDIDKQQKIFSDKAAGLLGDSDPSVLSSPEVIDRRIAAVFPNPTGAKWSHLTNPRRIGADSVAKLGARRRGS